MSSLPTDPLPEDPGPEPVAHPEPVELVVLPSADSEEVADAAEAELTEADTVEPELAEADTAEPESAEADEPELTETDTAEPVDADTDEPEPQATSVRMAGMDKSSSTILVPVDLLDIAAELAEAQALPGRAEQANRELDAEHKARLEPILEPDGMFHPIAASILRVVARSSLTISIDLSYESDSSNPRIWSTARQAVASSGLFSDLYMLHPISASQLPQVIGQLLVLRPPSFVADSVLSIDRNDLMQATGSATHDEAMAVLTETGLEPIEAALLLDLQRPNVRRWRITSTWSTPEGRATSELAGIDAGDNGQWLAVGTRRPDESIQLNYRPQGDGDTVRALRSVLPKLWTSTPLSRIG
jgi:hypothetical protein